MIIFIVGGITNAEISAIRKFDQMYKDIPWVLATGGSKGELAIWDTEEDMKIYTHFKG